MINGVAGTMLVMLAGGLFFISRDRQVTEGR
jgi:hypothetical protein